LETSLWRGNNDSSRFLLQRRPAQKAWADLSKSRFKVGIDATSFWSDDGGLTSHLQTRDLFDVSKLLVER
jgi:hypothetical protein